ncbi:MAG: outer membrane lipoprotein carrier protein LolA [Candidatus Hydrogenedentales bacterium]|jgi:outer membrane lipoprotein-sorting protein
MFISALLVSIVASAAEPAPSPAATPEVPPVVAFLADFAQKRDHIQSLTARFFQENVTPDETTPSSGEIIYIKPRRIMFRYADPEVTYLIDGLRVYEYDAQLEQVQVYDLGDDPQAEALFLGFDSDTTRLQQAYDVALVDPEKPDLGKHGLELTPKQKPKQEDAEPVTPLFNKVRLTLRDGDYLPSYIHVFNDNDSEVRISVTNVEVNPALDPKQTQLDLPEGTRIIQNEQDVETVGPGGKRIPEIAQTDIAPTAPASTETKP